jgi:hypothetical protein
MSAASGVGMRKAGELTRKQERGIAALLTAGTPTRAAAEAGVNERTLRRWLKEPAFAQAYAEARRQCLEVALTRLQEATGQAAVNLVAHMAAQDPNVALRAAVAVIDRGVRAGELLDIEPRLAEVERKLKQQGLKRK